MACKTTINKKTGALAPVFRNRFEGQRSVAAELIAYLQVTEETATGIVGEQT